MEFEMNNDTRNFFTDGEWDTIVWALEQESMLQPEEEWEKYGIIIDNINAKIARARAKGLDSKEIGEGQIEFYDDITKSNFKTKTGPFFDRRKKAGGGIAKEAGDSSGPPPESGPNSQGLQGLLNRVKKT